MTATGAQAEFWSKVAKSYDGVVDASLGPGTRFMLRERLASEPRLGSVAEFGCGTGFFTEVLAGKSDAVIATDLAPGMLEIAKKRVSAGNVAFRAEDCQSTNLPENAFDTVFLALVIHFTDPPRTVAEMRRILKPGGTLLVANIDPRGRALKGFNRVRYFLRLLYRGITGYRTKPPKGLGDNGLPGRQLCDLLNASGFKVVSMDTIRDTSASSNPPVEYIKAVKA